MAEALVESVEWLGGTGRSGLPDEARPLAKAQLAAWFSRSTIIEVARASRDAAALETFGAFPRHIIELVLPRSTMNKAFTRESERRRADDVEAPSRRCRSARATT
jgi:hypothetical protein